MCNRRGCKSQDYRPAKEPLHKTWVWCPGCQDFSEMDRYDEFDLATAPSRKVTRQGDKKEEKEDKEAKKKQQEADAKAAQRTPKKTKNKKKPKEVYKCEQRDCTFETKSKRGLSIHVTAGHLQKCEEPDCDFETLSKRGFSTHQTRMHPKPLCEEHPWYTGQRKPRSGCKVCLAAYEENQ